MMPALSACGGEPLALAQPAPQSAPAVPVHTAEVVTAALDAPIRAPGRVVAKHQVDLSFEVGGVIAAVLVEEGDVVRRGQILARLEPTPISARARAASAALDKAERDLARARALHERGSVPEATYQDANTAREMAHANHEAAAFDARHLVLIAPVDGRIDHSFGERGEVVGPGTPMMRMTSSSGGYVVRAAITDSDVLDVREGDSATVTLDARPNQPMRAHVSEVAGTSAPATGMFDVELTIDEGDARFEGMSAKIAIERRDPPRLVIPISALVEGDGERASVFAPDARQQHAQRIQIRVARLVDDRVAVLEGLSNVPVVITEGAERLSDGSLIRIAR